MVRDIQPRRDEYGEPPPGLARRATDTVLRGMKVKVDDSEQAWEDWEQASSESDELSADTEPARLVPDGDEADSGASQARGGRSERLRP